jgi:hypothetical protein
MNLFERNKPVSDLCPSKVMNPTEAKRRAAWILMSLLPLSSNAQDKRSDPTDPTQTAVVPHYESAFKNYQAAANLGEISGEAWRAANDQVARLRGHAGHVGDVEPHKAASPSAPAMPKSAPTPTKPAGHASHHDHGGK